MMGSKHKAYCLHAEVWWLSQGYALTLLYHLCAELIASSWNTIATWKNNEQINYSYLDFEIW